MEQGNLRILYSVTTKVEDLPRHVLILYNAIETSLGEQFRTCSPGKVLNALLEPSVVWALRLVLEEGRELKRSDSLAVPRPSRDEWRTVKEEPGGQKARLFETIRHIYWQVKETSLGAPAIYRNEKIGLAWEMLVTPRTTS